MSNPYLRRYVWLTSTQRERLAQAVEACNQVASCESLSDLSNELHNIDKRKASMPRVVQMTIKGLRMPEDILPIFVCDDVADTLINTVGLDAELSNIIKPRPNTGTGF